MMRIDFKAEFIDRAMPVLLALKKARPSQVDELDRVLKQSRHGVTIELRPFEFKQTDEQRGYYHMWKNAFAQYTGNTPDEMHEHLLCEAYGSEVRRTGLGLVRRPLQRSSKANRTDYSFLIDTLIRVAADMGFVVPPPVRKMED